MRAKLAPKKNLNQVSQQLTKLYNELVDMGVFLSCCGEIKLTNKLVTNFKQLNKTFSQFDKELTRQLKQ